MILFLSIPKRLKEQKALILFHVNYLPSPKYNSGMALANLEVNLQVNERRKEELEYSVGVFFILCIFKAQTPVCI